MREKYKQVHFNCAHETTGLSTDIVISDHHRLSKREIFNLLRRAKQTGSGQVRNSIQIRLKQGIKGISCPRTINDTASKKENEVSMLYLDHKYKRPTNLLVNKLHRIMNF